jgi:hypothetical protein
MSISHFPIAPPRPRPDVSTKGRAVALAPDGATPDRREAGIATRAPPHRGAAMTAAPETEFRRGWPAVLACFCVAVFAWGFGFYGQAVFLAELHRIHGWPTSTIGAATTVPHWCFVGGAAGEERPASRQPNDRSQRGRLSAGAWYPDTGREPRRLLPIFAVQRPRPSCADTRGAVRRVSTASAETNAQQAT